MLKHEEVEFVVMDTLEVYKFRKNIVVIQIGKEEDFKVKMVI